MQEYQLGDKEKSVHALLQQGNGVFSSCQSLDRFHQQTSRLQDPAQLNYFVSSPLLKGNKE